MILSFGRCLSCCLLAIALGLIAVVSFAQDEPAAPRPVERLAPPPDPAKLGLRIPVTGKRVPGGARVVLAPDEDGKPVACRVHCQIGEVYIVILPSGLMKSVPANEITPTERPFQALTAEQVLARLKGNGFDKFKGAASGRYVYLYRCQERFYQNTRDILESLYDGVTKYLAQWKLPLADPEVPLIVLIFPDRPSFDVYQKVADDMLAYYNGVSNFVVLHEDPELTDAAPEFALKQAAYTIAHEGVHQILHNVGIQQRLAPWPAWLSEGLPELFCPIKVTSTLVSEGGSSLPTRRLRWTRLGLINDIRMRSLLDVPATSGSVVEQIVDTKQLDVRGYAIAWGMTFYLSSKQPKQFQNYLREVTAIEPLAGFPESHQESDKSLFVKHFGGDFAQIETQVAKYLTSAPVQSQYRDPIANQKHYVVVQNVRQGRATQVTVYISTSPGGARKWKEEQENNKKGHPANARHTFRTEVCDNRQQAEAIVARIGGKR